MVKGNSELGEQALNKAVEVGLSTQLDAVETLEAEIHTEPVALMQGELKSANIRGRGLVMQEDLRAEELTVKTDGLAIDPIKAAFGNIELTRPTHATVAVVLTETDIERAFNSAYIHQRLENLDVSLEDRPVHVSAQDVRFSLPGDGRVAIATDVNILETGEIQPLALSAIPTIGSQGHQVVLNQVQIQSENAPQPLIDHLMELASTLLDLRNFALDGLTLQLQDIDVQVGRMVLKASAQLNKFPGN